MQSKETVYFYNTEIALYDARLRGYTFSGREILFLARKKGHDRKIFDAQN